MPVSCAPPPRQYISWRTHRELLSRLVGVLIISPYRMRLTSSSIVAIVCKYKYYVWAWLFVACPVTIITMHLCSSQGLTLCWAAGTCSPLAACGWCRWSGSPQHQNSSGKWEQPTNHDNVFHDSFLLETPLGSLCLIKIFCWVPAHLLDHSNRKTAY